MPSGSAGRRYAQAIFSLAKEENKLDEWAGNLASLAYTFEQGEVKNFLENPKTTRESKINFVKNTLGGQVGTEALNLAQLLVRRERENLVGTIEQEYTRMWNRLKGIEVAQVTTAVPVDAAEEDRIRTSLARLTGKQVTLEMKVDPEIIGGVIAQVGDTLLDGSMRTRLQNLRKQLA